ncbi:MAG TPA: PKD domain-containing protein, partial [Candidatus Thermoplasmatota archaeon]|nr:PKD domain-containing protein [Candidatus Thermoplasmatota archaeon]
MKKNPLLRTKSKHPITKPVLYTTTFLLLAVCLLPLAISTTPAPSIRLPDRPVTMIVTDGQHSYFDIDLSDVPPNLDVANQEYKGWCADRFVTMPRNQELTVRLYNNYDLSLPVPLRENWSKVNYILNHHDGATKIDVQGAFWYLLCDYPYSSLTSTAKILVDTAQNEFIPQSGEWIAILAEPIQNDSHPWPFQFSFLQVRLPSQGPEPVEPTQTTTTISHGYRYNDIAPTADTNGPYSGYAKETVEFSAAASVDPDGIIILYKWSFGDGTTAEGTTATHTYSHAGTYQVRLKVTDNFGLSDTDVTNATITVRNNPPTPFINGPVNGTTNTIYAYAFSATDQEPLITYQINWGDGTPTQTATHPS